MPESYHDPSCRIIVAWQGNNYIKKLYLWNLLHPSMDCMSTETLTVKYTLKYGFSTIISFSIICWATCSAFALFIPKFLLYLESLLWKLLIPLVIEAYLMLKSIIKFCTSYSEYEATVISYESEFQISLQAFTLLAVACRIMRCNTKIFVICIRVQY